MLTFISIPVTLQLSPWCVDGRPDYSAAKGPQMLGGSLHLVALRIIYENRILDSAIATETLNKLKDAGFALGVHRGAHKYPKENKSDCGFSDRLIEVLEKAREQKDEIITRLLTVNDEMNDIFGTEAEVSTLLESAYEKLTVFDLKNFEIVGEKLIKSFESAGATTVNLTGDHGEQTAFVNLKPNTTLDTNSLNKSGKQAFNLDLWAVVPQASALGIGEGFATAASLILYQATEMVLVEDKGKLALPVIIHQ